MPFAGQRPKVLLGTRSELRKRRRERQVEQQERLAKARFETAKYAAALADQQFALRDIAYLVRVAVDGGTLPPDAPCSLEAIRRLIERWRGGARSCADYADRARSGRPAGQYDLRLVKIIIDAIAESTYTSVLQLTRLVERAARELTDPPAGRVPSYHAVMRMVQAAGPVARVAARYGSRAAELYAQPHGTYATQYTHDEWRVDETMAPWYEVAWDEDLDQFVSVRPHLIIVRDYKSGVVVGYAISDPTQRTGEDGRMMRGGYDTADVFAALLSAACPEVSPASTRPFAGHLPKRIRWDNDKTHVKLGRILRHLGGQVTLDASGLFQEPTAEVLREGVPAPATGIDVPPMRVRFPKARGDVEALLKYVKQLCIGMQGHVDRVEPTDRLGTEPEVARSQAASAGTVEPRVERVPPEALPTRAEQLVAFDAVIARYNSTHRNRVHQRTARSRFFQFFPPHPRKGHDLLLALPPHAAVVQGNGIVVYVDKHEYRYSTHVDGVALEVGSEVTYRLDPLFRGIWILLFGHWRYVLAKETAALDPARAQAEARHRRLVARAASGEAADARERAAQARVGLDAALTHRLAADVDAMRQQVQEAAQAAQRARADAEEAKAAALRVVRATGGVPRADATGGDAPAAAALGQDKRPRGGRRTATAPAEGGQGPAAAPTPVPASPPDPLAAVPDAVPETAPGGPAPFDPLQAPVRTRRRGAAGPDGGTGR